MKDDPPRDSTTGEPVAETALGREGKARVRSCIIGLEFPMLDRDHWRQHAFADRDVDPWLQLYCSNPSHLLGPHCPACGGKKTPPFSVWHHRLFQSS